MPLEHISLTTTPIHLYMDEQLVSQGTGFFWAVKYSQRSATAVFLVTNYHVLTGSAPDEKKQPIGNRIRFYLHRSRDQTGDVKEVQYPLFTTKGTAVWLNSSTYPMADVAVIPLPSLLYEGTALGVLDEKWVQTRLRLRPASGATLIGYPYGFLDNVNFLPVWKTGSIASEPDVDFGGEPVLLVDVSSFPGMSGAPVCAIRTGTYETMDGWTSGPTKRQFIGDYASMQMLKEKRYIKQLQTQKKYGITLSQSLELGHVWKAKVLHDIMNGFDLDKYQSRVISQLGDLK